MIGFTWENNTLAIDKKVAALTDMTPAFTSIGEYKLLSTRRFFDAETSPEGRKWAPLSPAYAKRKAKKPSALRGILTLRGILRDTIAYKAAPRAVAIGSNRKYAAIHQFGGRTKRGGVIPARPYLGLSEVDRQEISAIIADYLDKA